MVKTITALTAKRLGQFLAKDFRQMFGPAYDETADRLGSLARSIIECLGTSDALYHNMEHTLLVTMASGSALLGLSLCHQIEPDRLHSPSVRVSGPSYRLHSRCF